MRNGRSFSLLSWPIILVGCLDASRASGPVGASRATLAIAPHFAREAISASALLAGAGLSFDHVRILVVRPAVDTRPVVDTLKDTTIAFQPGDAAKRLELSIAAVPKEVLKATIQYAQGSTVLFEGSASVIAIASSTERNSTTAAEIEVLYTGPGATAAKVHLAPGSGVYPAGTPTQFVAAAFDNLNGPLLTAPFAWTVSDQTVATVSATGMVTPKVERGTVQIRAMTASGAADTVTVTFAPVASRLRVIQGAAQVAPRSSTLPVPVIVEAVSADGLPASSAGQTVTFAAVNGGAITPASAVFDATGRAKAFVALGPTAGATYLYTATSGAFSVTFAEIAAVGAPAQLILNGPTAYTVAAGGVLNPLPSLRVADADGNSVPGASLRVTLQRAGVTVKQGSILSDTVGRLQVDAEMPGVVGSYTLTVESAESPAPFAPVVFTVDVVPGAAAKLAFGVQPTAGKADSIVSPAITVLVQDSFGNTVTNSNTAVTVVLDPLAITSGLFFQGTNTVNAVNGVATFADLSFHPLILTGVRIIAQANGLSQVISATFNITP